MLWDLLSLAAVGLALGGLGRTAVRGPNALPWWRALASGLVGALAGGLLTSVALGRTHTVTILVDGALFAAMLVLGSASHRRARALPPPE